MAGTSTLVISGVNYEIYGSHLTAIVGPPTYPSAVGYFGASLTSTAFAAAGFSTQQKALVEATRMLDRQRWQSTPTDTTTPQPLEFPRVGLSDKNGVTVADADVPENLVLGAYELANALIVDAAIVASADGGSNLKREKLREKIDVLETETEKEYFRTTAGPGAARFPVLVHELVRQWLEGGAHASSIVSGTDVATAFDGVLNDFTFVTPGLP